MTRLAALFLCWFLTACGSDSNVPAPIVSAPAITVSGTAATGDAIAGRIYLKDSAGHEKQVDTADGHFSFDVAGLTAPYMLKAEWAGSGGTERLYSFAAGNGHANITPLTHMAVAAAAGVDSLDAIYSAGSPSTLSAIANALPAALADLQLSMKPLFALFGATGADPFADALTADHTGMDALLDSISITYASGTVTVTDKTSGATLLQAPTAQLAQALAMFDWSAQDAAQASDPDIAVNAQGTGLVVWTQVLAGHSVVQARFLSGSGAAAVTLSPSGDAGLPRVAFDASGNAVAVWAQYENNRNDIWGARYGAASHAWGSAVRVSSASASSDAYVPSIGVDAAGNAVVAWHQGDGRSNHFDVWASVFAASQNVWAAPVLVSDSSYSAYGPRVAVNAAGQGLVAWQQELSDGTTVSNGPKDVWARSVSSAGVWGASAKINAVGGDADCVYGQIALALDSQGNGMALWVQTSGVMPFVIHAARYAAGGGWQASAVITDNVLDNCYGPQLAFDANGNAMAVWQQQTGVGAYGGFNRFVAGTGWGSSGQFASESLGDVYDPHVAVDAAGNATAIWYQWEQMGINVRTSRHQAANGWAASNILSSTPTDGGFSYPVPRVAAGASGPALAVWGTDSY